MKYTKQILLMAVAMLPVLASAQLSSRQTIVANVPFEFVVGTKPMPAGEWTVRLASMSATVLEMQNQSSAAGMFSRATLVESKKPAGQCTLVFRRYGNIYFLSEVQFAGTRLGYRLPQSKAEAEIRAQNVTGDDETLVASLQ